MRLRPRLLTFMDFIAIFYQHIAATLSKSNNGDGYYVVLCCVEQQKKQ